MTLIDQSPLHHGIAAARAGQRDPARTLLLQALEHDERNEQAWLWLSGVMETPEEQRICLENVLEINPHCAQAQQGLAWLNTHHPRSTAPEAATTDAASLVIPVASDVPQATPLDAPSDAGRCPR